MWIRKVLIFFLIETWTLCIVSDDRIVLWLIYWWRHSQTAHYTAAELNWPTFS